MIWLKGLWAAFTTSKVAMIAVAALTAIGVVLGIFANERAKGREQERARQDKAALENKAKTDRIEQEIGSLPPEERDKRGEKWVNRP